MRMQEFCLGAALALLDWLMGGAQIVGALCDHPALRRASEIAAFTAWAFIAFGLIAPNALVPAIAAYGTLALLNIRAALGRMGNA